MKETQRLLCVCAQSGPTLCNLWTVACLTPLSRGFSRQEYWSGFPLPFPMDLPNPESKLKPLTSPAIADGFFTTHAT